MTPRTLEVSALAPAHPSLRWRPVGGIERQHRRAHHIAKDETPRTACGLPGPLVVADGEADYCPECFPWSNRQ